MASPGEIAQILPDTLPADFSGWDSEDFPAARPAHSSGVEAVSRGMGVAPRLAVQPPAPQITPEAAALPTMLELRKAKSGMATTMYVDDDGIFRQLKNVSSFVDKLPGVKAPMETAASEMDERRSSASLEAELMQAARRPFSGEYESEFGEGEEPQPKINKMRNLILTGAGTTVLLFAYQMVHAGMMASRAVAAQPEAAVTQPAAGTLKSTPPNGRPHGTQAVPTGTSQALVVRLSTLDTQPVAGPRPAAAKATPVPVPTQMMHDQLTAPKVISLSMKKQGVPEAPPTSDLNTAGVEGGGGNGTFGNVFNGQPRPTVTTVPAKPVSISEGIAVGLLIKKSEPSYPPIAKSARVSGTVVLQATISKTGAVSNLRIVSGPALLRQAALEAVRTWRYRPYRLNNQPVDVDTTVSVIFKLG